MLASRFSKSTAVFKMDDFPIYKLISGSTESLFTNIIPKTASSGN